MTPTVQSVLEEHKHNEESVTKLDEGENDEQDTEFNEQNEEQDTELSDGVEVVGAVVVESGARNEFKLANSKDSKLLEEKHTHDALV